MTFAVKEHATVFLDERDPGRAEMQINHLVGLIGERKLFLILFKWPQGLSTSEYAEPETTSFRQLAPSKVSQSS